LDDDLMSATSRFPSFGKIREEGEQLLIRIFFCSNHESAARLHELFYKGDEISVRTKQTEFLPTRLNHTMTAGAFDKTAADKVTTAAR
jgi:hypothetical protein